MKITAKELSIFLGGELVGDPLVVIHAPSKIEEGKPGTISFLANPKYEPYVYKTEASVLLVNKSFEPSQEIPCTLIKVDDVYASIGVLLAKFNTNDDAEFKVSSLAFIDDNVDLHDKVTIGAFTVIKERSSVGEGTRIAENVSISTNVQIGKDCIIYPGVKIYANSVIGDYCIIHSGAVIGCDGFGYSQNKETGAFEKIQHVGNVILENYVEIGANTVIDRGTMGSTIIRKGVKIDNLVQIAHNVEIGENTAMAAQSGIAGSTKIGKRAMIGGQAGIVGHRTIADGVQVQAQSGVISNVSEVGKKLYGSPALEYKEYLKAYALMKNLPTMKSKIADLEKQLNDLINKSK